MAELKSSAEWLVSRRWRTGSCSVCSVDGHHTMIHWRWSLVAGWTQSPPFPFTRWPTVLCHKTRQHDTWILENVALRCVATPVPIRFNYDAHAKIEVAQRIRCRLIYTVFQKSDVKIQITITTAYLIRIKYPLRGFNYHLSDVNIANFNKIHRIVSEQQLF